MSNSDKPVFQFRAAPPEKQNRWGVLLRGFLVIPQFIFVFFMLYAASALTFLGWFYMIFTGRNPFFEFSAKAVRAYQRYAGYQYFLTSKYPRISLEEDPQYAMASALEQGQLVRMKVLFRVILMIPVLIVWWGLSYGMLLMGFFSWVILLIRGKLPRSMHQATVAIIRFQGRALAYVMLLQDPYPGGLFGDKANEAEESALANVDGAEPDGPVAFYATDQIGAAVPINDASPTPIDAVSRLDSADLSSDVNAYAATPPTWALTLSAGARRLIVAALVIGVAGAGLYTAFVPRWQIPNNNESNISASSWNSQYRGDVVGFRHAISSYHSTFNSKYPNWSTLLNDCQNLQNDYKTFDSVPYYPGSADTSLVTGLGAIYTTLNDCATVIAPFKVSKAMPYFATQMKTGNSDLNDFLQQTSGYQSGQST